MPKSGSKGPQILKADAVGKSYEPAYSLRWPVFPVKVSQDPEEIRAAVNETSRYAKDPSGTGERELAPQEWFTTGDPSAVGLDEVDLMDGYVIPTSTDPVSTYDVFDKRPRVLDQVLKLRLSSPEGLNQTLAFVEEFGLLGSPLWLGKQGWQFGEPLAAAYRQLLGLQRLSASWLRLQYVPVGELLPIEEELLAPYVDRMAISELIVELNERLRRGVFPSLRFATSTGGAIRFTTGFTCQTLLSALYLQLYLDVTGSREYARCPGCGILFGQERSNQVYCTPDCSNAHRQRRHRESKRRQGKD